MLKKRIIPCLDIKDGTTVKGVNFINIINAGDPVELAKRYVDEGADELVFLDITATVEKRKTLAMLVSKIAKEINIPFTVGGGIQSWEDAAILIKAGADKISINSAAVRNLELINEIASVFGRQCVVVAIDAKFKHGNYIVYLNGGRTETDIDAIDWAIKAEKAGAGEILLTSMDADGTKNGFELELTRRVCESVNIPVIASGGAGKDEHFKDVFLKTTASGALAASIFHFNEIPIPELKNYLKQKKIPVR
ncbi:MAG: imidazole glycerol phosphate synthase subunit HisF [Bacteroidetes bacterium]|nr:imidazole glycerol phosphate synthase subunit HisF [Bacteroidota bacterium]